MICGFPAQGPHPAGATHWPGGLLVSSIVWLGGQRLLVRLLIGPGYTAYGIVGTFIAVMIWVYYVSAILFLGAEFIEALAIVAGRATKAKR